jgi:hypothetical protein
MDFANPNGEPESYSNPEGLQGEETPEVLRAPTGAKLKRERNLLILHGT